MGKMNQGIHFLKTHGLKAIPAILHRPVYASDGVGRFLCPDYGALEQMEDGWESEVKKLIAGLRDSLFLDVGANIGKYSVLAAKNGNRVIAVEPSPYVAYYLHHNLELNNCNDVQVILAAAWNKSEVLTFYAGEHMGMGTVAKARTGRRYEVLADTLDNILRGEIPDFIKMDANWAERQAIEGLSRTLAKKKPPIVFEANDLHDLADVSALLMGYGYEITPLDRINFLARVP
jgi:FkbM family methyltransferase